MECHRTKSIIGNCSTCWIVHRWTKSIWFNVGWWTEERTAKKMATKRNRKTPSPLYKFLSNCKRNCSSNFSTHSSLVDRRLTFSLKTLCIDPSGHLVNYRQLRRHAIYNDLCELTKHLANINLDTVTENERKTFFISNECRRSLNDARLTRWWTVADLYNALTIHGIAKLTDPPKSVLDLNQFWKTTSYQVGPHLFCLDDIQHGILRGETAGSVTRERSDVILIDLGNKPHSNCTQRHFTFNDPRTKYSMRRCDPRIHFVLNCGARSSPQITIYSSSHLEKALNMATTSYCNTEVRIDMEKNEVFLPKLFLWYRNDFGRSDCDVLRFAELGVELSIRLLSSFADGLRSSLMSRNDPYCKLYSINKYPRMVCISPIQFLIGCSTITVNRVRRKGRPTTMPLIRRENEKEKNSWNRVPFFVFGEMINEDGILKVNK